MQRISPRTERWFARCRAEALAGPRTRADRLVMPSVELTGGVLLGISVNK